jgi:hypothetical protein
MSKQIEKLLEVAQGELGYLEKKSNAQLDSKEGNAGSGNYTKYWRDLAPSLQGQPWCAAYCVWCARRAGIAAGVAPDIFSCSQFIAWFKARGQWLERTMVAKPGDLVFFGDAKGAPAHVGLVYKADSRICTYEGNTSSAQGVVDNGGAVAAKSYEHGYSRILGYGRPKYIEEDEDMFSYDDFKAYMARYDKEVAAQPPHDWAEATWKRASAYEAAAGQKLCDGTNPRGAASREQLAALFERLGLIK